MKIIFLVFNEGGKIMNNKLVNDLMMMNMSAEMHQNMNKPSGLSPDLGYPHISKDPNRGYIENDPILRVGGGKNLSGEHGLMDINAEVGRTAYNAGMIDSPIITGFFKK